MTWMKEKRLVGEKVPEITNAAEDEPRNVWDRPNDFPDIAAAEKPQVKLQLDLGHISIDYDVKGELAPGQMVGRLVTLAELEAYTAAF